MLHVGKTIRKGYWTCGVVYRPSVFLPGVNAGSAPENLIGFPLAFRSKMSDHVERIFPCVETSMPLPSYGVLIGNLNHFNREDPNNYGSWYHGKLYVDAPDGQYEGAIDVSTPSGIKVEYRVVNSLDQKLFGAVSSLAPGWHQLTATSSSGALDYIRSPLLHPRRGCLTLVYSPLAEAINQLLQRESERWTESTGDNALNILESLLTVGGKIYVFGAPYTSGRGVHDIHMNQGDPPGQFQHLDGVWQDGGTIVVRPDGTLVAFLTKFATQSLNTDANGLPI
jgi:uncharacterized protein YukJ